MEEPSPVNVAAPERSAPPSTASYEEAMAKPESLDVHDDRVHLTDAQLTGPMRAVLSSSSLAVDSRPRFTVLGTDATYVKFGLDAQESVLVSGTRSHTNISISRECTSSGERAYQRPVVKL